VSDAMVIAITGVVLVVVTAGLVFAMVRSIHSERRRSNARGIWRNFGLSIAFCALFFASWIAQAVAEWGTYRGEQRSHGEPTTISGYFVEFGQSTLENWQSEFLQLFSFVVLSAILIHRGSAESKDSVDRMEAALKRIEKRLDEMERPSPAAKAKA
jgi:succinate dehydrogenase hydrophobic anchor subunit